MLGLFAVSGIEGVEYCIMVLEHGFSAFDSGENFNVEFAHHVAHGLEHCHEDRIAAGLGQRLMEGVICENKMFLVVNHLL